MTLIFDKRILFVIFFCIFFLFSLVCEPVQLSCSLSGKWYQVERSNWSQYRDGKYIGLTNRETRATLNSRSNPDGSSRYSGYFYILEQTLRDLQKTAKSLDEVIETSFTMTPQGKITVSHETGYPRLRSFPLLPAEPVSVGERWEGEAIRVIDPLNNGRLTFMPIQVQYQYIGEELYRDEPVHRIRAKYGTRINKYRRNIGDDPELVNASGTHDIEILVSAQHGSMVLMLDRLDEIFYYADGSTIRYRGSTAIFGEVPAPVDHASILIAATPYGVTSITDNTEPYDTPTPAFQDVPSSTAGKSIPKATTEPTKTDKNATAKNAPFSLETTAQGVRLSIRDIRFLADSDTILSEESWRLDAIAKTLRQVSGGRFLVEGHTADVGNPVGEKSLSIKRAKRIIDELIIRGLTEENFMFTGYGGTRPIADNTTSDGRALNRRVEITILE
ncbi:MAG TPA: OmpA family protein [Treponema sp.]|nr:OmpA family protein [Treponema sp.]